MQRCDLLIGGNIQLLRQGIDLIRRLDDAAYSRENATLSLNAAGCHFRHCIDFYNCFLGALGTRRINFDLRRRDEILENNRAIAILEIERIIEGLRQLSVTDGQTRLNVILNESTPRAPSAWGRSSVMRELQSLMSHTIHHYALIALALRLQSFEPGAEFGVAPSTLEYWRRTA
jgi:hypothetical protein